MKGFTCTAVGLLMAAPAQGFMPPVATRTVAHGLSRAASTSPRTGLFMAEKVAVEEVKRAPGPADPDVVAAQTPVQTPLQTEELVNSAKEVFDSVQDVIKNLNLDTAQEDLKAVVEGFKTNVQAGEAGERGEAWALAKAAILLFALLGSVPVLGGPLEFLAGPGLLLGGLGLSGISLLQLGKNFSPWPTPGEGSVLVTTGPYSLCRHPLYAGLVSATLGLGFTTDSFTRIALGVLLGYVLDRMASMEEEKLVEVHPAYKTYKEEVAKFFPKVY